MTHIWIRGDFKKQYAPIASLVLSTGYLYGQKFYMANGLTVDKDHWGELKKAIDDNAEAANNQSMGY